MQKLRVLKDGFVAFFAYLKDEVFLIDFNGTETDSPAWGGELFFIVFSEHWEEGLFVYFSFGECF